ncbi:hypothetical protein MM326_18665 [Alkalihalobacillus sp. LMS6]|uniref:ATP-grasp fold amidoligase family protein n=1 Tax=Alkalihalobacillus sp. LMS6 TaxID=2924034 RepID=UPI0020D02C82|nr:ATP-grasp fold amidoligase family protein [Alkalihalobacillus sp. LMS6]UTR06077.1 hypothetical protein MM326_18665 [Alkalihalobacillus sp. LMS6]
MKIFIKRAVNQFSFTQKILLRLIYFKHHKRLLNLEQPKTFTEKIQWAKMYGNLERLGPYIDKYEVRDFVEETIGSEYLISLIKVYDNYNELNLDELPNSFVLKATHSAGQNLIVMDKKEVSPPELSEALKNWFNTNYYHITGETNYKLIRPRVVAEELISNKRGLKDYKFYCFYGEVKFVQVVSDRKNKQKMDYLDLNWNPIDLESSIIEKSKSRPEKPQNFELMIELAQKLSLIFPFVRVDLYDSDGKVFFGELTFTPANGLRPYKHIHQDEWLGNLVLKEDIGSIKY